MIGAFICKSEPVSSSRHHVRFQSARDRLSGDLQAHSTRLRADMDQSEIQLFALSELCRALAILAIGLSQWLHTDSGRLRQIWGVVVASGVLHAVAFSIVWSTGSRIILDFELLPVLTAILTAAIAALLMSVGAGSTLKSSSAISTPERRRLMAERLFLFGATALVSSAPALLPSLAAMQLSTLLVSQEIANLILFEILLALVAVAIVLVSWVLAVMCAVAARPSLADGLPTASARTVAGTLVIALSFAVILATGIAFFHHARNLITQAMRCGVAPCIRP